MSLFDDLETIDTRPRPFAFYTAGDLWTDEHTSARMLAFHLDETLDVASRSAAFIDRSVKWIVSRFKVGQATRIADYRGDLRETLCLQLAGEVVPVHATSSCLPEW